MSEQKKKLDEFRRGLESSHRPLFIFDGDADGMTSFTLLYHKKGDGKGVMVSGRPQLGEEFLRKVEEYQPDTLFILDLAQVTQEFLDKVKIPIYWLDHHEPPGEGLHLPGNLHYFNPRVYDNEDNRPTAFWAYNIVKQDLWIAMIGIVADYHFLLADEFRKDYEDLLPRNIKHQREALVDSGLGRLVKIINFNLKGTVRDAMTSVKIFGRIESPYEILQRTSARGKYLYKRYERINKEYTPLLEEAKKVKSDDGFLVFIYHNQKISVSSELSNELKNLFPEKIIIIGRSYDGRVNMSLRSETNEIVTPLKKTLEQVGGNGGGHALACGASVEEDKLEEFLKVFKKEYLDSIKD